MQREIKGRMVEIRPRKEVSLGRQAQAAAQKERAKARKQARALQAAQPQLSPDEIAAQMREDHVRERMLARVASERERRLSINRLNSYAPYPKQREFHDMGAIFRERAMMAGNQLGKTTAGAAEAAMHLTGRYPNWWRGRVFNRPVRATVGSETAELTRDGVQRLLVGPPRDEKMWGTGMVPKETLADWSRRAGVPDAVDGMIVRWGGGGDVQASHSSINFKSYDQGRAKWQADTLDFVWLDEEAPLDIYSEALTRVSSTSGMVFSTFTPLLGMSEVCRRFLLEPSPDRGVINMEIAEAAHYTNEQREKIVAGYPAHEREARAKGIPSLGSGRIFPVAEEDISIAARIFPKEFVRIRGLDFGWDHPFACIEMVWDRDEDVVYVTRCLKMRQSSPVLHASAIRAWGSDWIPIAWPHDGLQHDKGSGDELASQYRKERLNMIAERATFVDGGSGVEAGLMEMLSRMQTGRLKVFAHLNEWFEEFRLYHRKDGKVVKEFDDLMAATRYALMMLRWAITEPVKRNRHTPRGSWQAA